MYVVRLQLRLLSMIVPAALVGGCATSGEYRGTAYHQRTLQKLAEKPLCIGDPSELLAGVARVDITPPVGMPLQGYASRRGGESKGVHDPLYARALVLKNSDAQLVLVSCDLMGVTAELYDAILAKANKRLPLARREFILFATHTHSGAGGLSNRFAMQIIGGRFRPKLFAEVTDRIADAIIEAVSQARPARIAFGRGEVEGVNRNRAKREAPVDREVSAVRVTATDGKPLAWLVNFAAHPTVFGANWEFTADYPGYVARELEKDGAVALFANGAAGNLNIGKQNDPSREARAERAGKAIAAKASETMDGKSSGEKVLLCSRLVDAELPPVRIRMGKNPDCALPGWWGSTLLPRRAPIHVVRIGEVLFLAYPFELSSEIGLELKQTAARLGHELFLIGYANDYLGYVLPERHYPTGAYEARTSFYGPKLDGYLEEIFVKMMEFSPR